MIDWRASMQHNYEFYIVDPSTWRDSQPIDIIKKCTINRDSSVETLGSATADCTASIDECYIRVYLIAIQNGVTSKVPLGTFLVQTPGTSFDGKLTSVSLDMYTPLIELKSDLPPVGYTIPKGTPVMATASTLCRENMRAPVVRTESDDVLESDFVAGMEEKWITFIPDLISNAKYKLGLDEMGRVIFEREQNLAALRSVWTYDDDNSSILYPDIADERDLYNIPNVVEVVYSTAAGYKYSRVVNDDPNSPVSIVSRGYTKTYRDSNPSFSGIPTQGQLDAYANQLLKNLSSLEHKITYRHSYCPVKVGDCVTLNYKRSGLVNVRAKVISQSISCETGCPVDETAVYTTNLWR